MPGNVFSELVKIGTVNGKSVIKPAVQVPQSIKNHRTLVRQTEGGVPTSLLNTDGGIINIKVPEMGGAIIKSLTLEVTFTVASAAVRLLPSPLMIDQLICYKGNGDQEAQKLNRRALVVM